MNRTAPSILVLALLSTGCAAENTDFTWGDADPADLAPAPETEEELTAALLASVFAPPMDEEAEYASVLDLLLEAAVPSAHADDTVPDECAPGEDAGWVSLSPNGPSGTFGASQNAVDVDSDTDYCQDSAGNWNSGNGLYKQFTLSGVTATCNWGGEYDLSATGVVRRVGQSGNKDISGTLSFSGDDAGSADCSLMANMQGDAEELHLAGICSGWTVGFDASPGTSCTLDLKPAE